MFFVVAEIASSLSVLSPPLPPPAFPIRNPASTRMTRTRSKIGDKIRTWIYADDQSHKTNRVWMPAWNCRWYEELNWKKKKSFTRTSTLAACAHGIESDQMVVFYSAGSTISYVWYRKWTKEKMLSSIPTLQKRWTNGTEKLMEMRWYGKEKNRIEIPWKSHGNKQIHWVYCVVIIKGMVEAVTIIILSKIKSFFWHRCRYVFSSYALRLWGVCVAFHDCKWACVSRRHRPRRRGCCWILMWYKWQNTCLFFDTNKSRDLFFAARTSRISNEMRVRNGNRQQRTEKRKWWKGKAHWQSQLT